MYTYYEIKLKTNLRFVYFPRLKSTAKYVHKEESTPLTIHPEYRIRISKGTLHFNFSPG